MSKSWMSKKRNSREYIDGVKHFINFAIGNSTFRDKDGVVKIRCPCKKCNNVKFQYEDDAVHHLLWTGIVPSYTNWTLHGEEEASRSSSTRVCQNVDEMEETVFDVTGARGWSGDDASRGRRSSLTLSQNRSSNRSSTGHITELEPTSGTPEDDVAGPSRKKQKVRGPTTLSELTNPEPGKRLPIEWGPINGRPIGDYANKLSNFCGIIARNRANVPIQLETSYHNFLKQQKSADIKNGDFLFGLVCDRFEIDKKDKVARKKVLACIGKCYSEYLCRTKDKYYTNKTEEDLRERPPPEMNLQDWQFLVRKWKSKEHEVISLRNTQNRARAVLKNTSGSRNHDKVYDEEIKKNGAPPANYDIFEMVHTDKSGAPLDPESARIISTVMQESARAEEEGIPVNKDDIFLKVRPKGLGKKKKGVYSNPQVAARIDNLMQQLQAKSAQMDEMKKKYDGDIDVLKNQLNTMWTAFQSAGIVLNKVAGSVANEVVGLDEEPVLNDK